MAETEVAGDFRTRPGREAARRQAREALPRLEQDFRTNFKKAGFPIFLTGNVPAFVELAADVADVVSVDLRKATADIRTAVKLSLGRNAEFSPSGFSALVREVRQTGATLGLSSIPDLSYDGPVYVGDEEAMHGLVDTYLLKYLGPDFIALLLEREASRQAQDLSCDSPVVPVVVAAVPTSSQDAIGAQLFTGKSLAADVGATPTADDVTKVFTAVRTALKQQ